MGATPVEAQKAAGHSSLDMTMLHTQTETEREREHVKKILERIPTPGKAKSKTALQQMQAAAGVQ